jgi:hypothetical protein
MEPSTKISNMINVGYSTIWVVFSVYSIAINTRQLSVTESPARYELELPHM